MLKNLLELILILLIIKYYKSKTMAAEVMGIKPGVPNFKVIDIDIQDVARCLQAYVTRGSKLTGVSLDEISLGVTALPKEGEEVTLVSLLEKGMKLFDAMVWMSAGQPKEYPLVIDPELTTEKVCNLQEIAKAVFYVYFFLLTQARYPVAVGQDNAPAVPNFLKVVMGLKDHQGTYLEKICSFNAVQFDARWARYVTFKGLGQEALSRFGLGVAGYRMFGPFKLYACKPGASDEVRRAYNFARAVATAPPSWAVHPLTRDPAVLTKRGNLNKNLSNLILEAFTEKQIESMVAAKVLFAKPKEEPAYLNYMQWSEDDDISGSQQIFPKIA